MVVVDEAILALTNYQLADPVAVFYQARGADVSATYWRGQHRAGQPEDLAQRCRRRRRMPRPTVQATGGSGGKRHGNGAAMERRRASRPCHGRLEKAAARRRCWREQRNADPVRSISTRWRPLPPRCAPMADGRAQCPGQAARQPDPLPRDGGGRGRRQAVRLRRGQPDGPPAPDGPAVGAALPQLWRPVSNCRSCCRTRPTSR